MNPSSDTLGEDRLLDQIEDALRGPDGRSTERSREYVRQHAPEWLQALVGRLRSATEEASRLRGALEKIACHQDAFNADCVFYAIENHGAHRPECAIAVAALGVGSPTGAPQ